MHFFFDIKINFIFYFILLLLKAISPTYVTPLILIIWGIWESIKFIHMRWFGFKKELYYYDFSTNHTYIIKLKESQKIKLVRFVEKDNIQSLLYSNESPYSVYYFEELSLTNKNKYQLEDIAEAKPFDFTNGLNIRYSTWKSYDDLF